MKNFKQNLLDSQNTGQSSHYTQGINLFSLLAISLFNAQLWSQVSWWFLPVTLLLALIGWGNEIQPRKTTKTTLTLS